MEIAEKAGWQKKGEDIWRGKRNKKRKNYDATFLSYL
jgi:hypothetical protein